MGDAIVAEGLAKIYRGGVWGLRNASFTCMDGCITILL